jgi:hypothetical protein
MALHSQTDARSDSELGLAAALLEKSTLLSPVKVSCACHHFTVPIKLLIVHI